jgi:hypothetical protein
MNLPTTQAEPALTRSAVVTVISVLSAMLVKTGGGSVSTWLNQNSDIIAGLILAVGPLVAGYLTRGKVTPLAAPKAADGSPLVPASTVNTVQVIPTDPVALAALLYPAPSTTGAPSTVTPIDGAPTNPQPAGYMGT